MSLILMLLLGLFALLITIYAVGAYLLPRGRGWEIAPAGILLLPLGLALLGYVSYRIYSMFRG